MLTDSEYIANETRAALSCLAAIETAPLADRKEGARDYAEALQVPGRIAERARWILDGSYGRGEYELAWCAINTSGPRTNLAAIFGQWVAAYDHGCPAGRARAEYRKLTKRQKEQIDRAILREVAQARKERGA